MALTDTWLRANAGKPRGKVEVFTDRDGLSVRASGLGKLVFQIRYRYAGKAKRLDLGSYPHMSLKQARAENERLRGEVERGRDPAVVVRLERHEVITQNSFRDVFLQYYQSYCKKQKKTHVEILRSFEIHVFPVLGSLPAAELTIHAWLSQLEPLAERRPAIAARVLAEAKQMYNWAIRREVLNVNPLAAISGKNDLGVKKGVVKRSLSDDEIRLLWGAIHGSRIARKNGILMIMCLVYACRVGELRQAKKADFNFETNVWTVPPENHKLGKRTGEPLLRPIIPEIKSLLNEAFALAPKAVYLFPHDHYDRPVGDRALLSPPYRVMQWVWKNKGVQMAHWSMHALRKTARTNFSTLTQPHIAEIMLGHTLPGEWKTYDHHDYLKEQAVAYSAWWERLMMIIGEN